MATGASARAPRTDPSGAVAGRMKSGALARRPDYARDSHSWASLVSRVARQTPNPADAADHLHSAWLAMCIRGDVAEIHYPRAFLVRAARNKALNEHKRGRFLAGLPCETLCDGVADPAPLPDEIAEHRARLDRFLTDLRRLPERTVEIFLQHRIEGRKYREIADAAGISESAVEKHVARARRFVADWVAREAALAGEGGDADAPADIAVEKFIYFLTRQ